MLTHDVPARPGPSCRAEALEAERQRLARRIGWALRRKNAERAERLEEELATVEARLAQAPRRRRPVWLPAALLRA